MLKLRSDENKEESNDSGKEVLRIEIDVNKIELDLERESRRTPHLEQKDADKNNDNRASEKEKGQSDSTPRASYGSSRSIKNLIQLQNILIERKVEEAPHSSIDLDSCSGTTPAIDQDGNIVQFIENIIKTATEVALERKNDSHDTIPIGENQTFEKQAFYPRRKTDLVPTKVTKRVKMSEINNVILSENSQEDTDSESIEIIKQPRRKNRANSVRNSPEKSSSSASLKLRNKSVDETGGRPRKSALRGEKSGSVPSIYNSTGEFKKHLTVNFSRSSENIDTVQSDQFIPKIEIHEFHDVYDDEDDDEFFEPPESVRIVKSILHTINNRVLEAVGDKKFQCTTPKTPMLDPKQKEIYKDLTPIQNKNRMALIPVYQNYHYNQNYIPTFKNPQMAEITDQNIEILHRNVEICEENPEIVENLDQNLVYGPIFEPDKIEQRYEPNEEDEDEVPVAESPDGR